MGRALPFAVAGLLVGGGPVLAQWSLPQSVELNSAAPGAAYLSVADKTDLTGLTAYTIEAWVHPTSYAGFPTIVGNDFRTSFWFGLNESGRVRFYPTGGAGNFVESNFVPILDQWTHLAVTYEEGVGWEILRNGVQDTSGTNIVGPVGTSAGDLRIGADRDDAQPAAYFWRGWLDEVRIWSERLAWPEIFEHRFVEVGRPAFQTPAYADLQANWDMNQSLPGQVFDRASGFGRADNFATFVNGAAPDDRVPPVSPNVAAFLLASPDYAVLPTGDGYGNGVTIEAWIAPFQFFGTQTIAGRDRDASFWLGLTSTGHVRFHPTGGAAFLESSAPVPEFGWSHVAATYRDGLTTIYRNGRVDAQTTAITGPVGENGRDVFVGADNHVPVPDLAYGGWLDEVRVIQGHKTPEQVLQEMFVGYTGFTNPDVAPSEDGVAPRWRADFDGISDVEVIGSGAVLHKSGAPIGNSDWITTSGTVYAFENEIPGGFGALPNGDLVAIRVIEIDVPFSETIHDVDLFVSMPSADLSVTDLVLVSPDDTLIGLLYGGDAYGRDLHTILDDDAIATYATGIPPYTAGVRPTDPLSTLDGEDCQGTWQFLAQGAPLDVWAVGLLINGRLATGVTSVASASPTGLRLAGPNPARQATRFAFELARPSRISVDLYDVAGRHRRTLARDSRSAGAHEVAWQRDGLPAGVYVVALRVDDRLAGSQRLVVRD